MTNQKIASRNETADNTAMLTLGLVFPGCCTLHVVEQFMFLQGNGGLPGEPGELGFKGDKVKWWDSRTSMICSVLWFDVKHLNKTINSCRRP